VGLGRAAPGLPGRPYIPAFIFFFFGDYGHQLRNYLIAVSPLWWK